MQPAQFSPLLTLYPIFCQWSKNCVIGNEKTQLNPNNYYCLIIHWQISLNNSECEMESTFWKSSSAFDELFYTKHLKILQYQQLIFFNVASWFFSTLFFLHQKRMSQQMTHRDALQLWITTIYCCTVLGTICYSQTAQIGKIYEVMESFQLDGS